MQLQQFDVFEAVPFSFTQNQKVTVHFLRREFRRKLGSCLRGHTPLLQLTYISGFQNDIDELLDIDLGLHKLVFILRQFKLVCRLSVRSYSLDTTMVLSAAAAL